MTAAAMIPAVAPAERPPLGGLDDATFDATGLLLLLSVRDAVIGVEVGKPVGDVVDTGDPVAEVE